MRQSTFSAIGGGLRSRGGRRRLPEHHEVFGFGVGERAEEQSVQDAEDGAVGGDAEGQREHDYGEEAGILQQAAEGEAHIGLEIVKE